MASSSSNLHGFFQPRKRKVKTIDLVNDEEVPPPTEEAPPPPKQAKPVTKYNKRRTATGFTEVLVIQSFLKIGDVGVCFPHICSLLKMLLSCPSNTSPLERSYATLRRICTQERNKLLAENIEVLYLLAALKLNVKEESEEYGPEIEFLEKK